ncbi:hypothetical protein FXO37_13528 [Capsicum annuum]|nr:hypothetical protein FXO37_13528 [Capsicum annuum]
MEESSSRRSKRPFVDEDDSNKPPEQKRVRFPKGKKAKQGDNTIDGYEDKPSRLTDARAAAKERLERRNQIKRELIDEEIEGEIADISRAEVEYEVKLVVFRMMTVVNICRPGLVTLVDVQAPTEMRADVDSHQGMARDVHFFPVGKMWNRECHWLQENETFIDDGIAIEPFNLNKEREEGFFDASGNYVEYLNENEIKDAWLDSVDTEKRYSGKSAMKVSNEDEIEDITSEQLAKMKRRIADVLEPGETVLQGLRRLKGTSNNKKGKMSGETKQLFDQLTEDAMKLMENGDFNVYDEKQESFQREAEGYEKLALARLGKSSESVQPKTDNILDEDFLPSGSNATAGGHSMHNADVASSNSYNSASRSDDAFDMFGDGDENIPANPASNGGDQHGDYVFDESSGSVPVRFPFYLPVSGHITLVSEYHSTRFGSSCYYYSSSMGYYYDPSSGLYCNASSGQWYSYNDESGIYQEVPQATSDAN